MKNINKAMRNIFVVIMMVMILPSCQDHLEDLYENPNAVTSVDDSALFNKAVRSLFQGLTDQGSSRFAGMHAHYYVAGSTWRNPDQYGDGQDGGYNGAFNGGYTGVIRHIEEVLDITSAPETANEVRNAMANVIAVLGFAKITDGFGDVPYTEGGKGKSQNILQPAYDTQESIYMDLIARLTSIIEVLKTAGPQQGYPDIEIIFNNDLEKWVRFANSVRLRLAMRIRYADPALSQSTVAQCLTVPLMEDPSHDAFMIETEGNGNEWFIRRVGFPSIKMSDMLVNQLQSTDDPRLSVFVSPDGSGEYSGIVNGLNDVAFGNSDFANKSDMGIPISSPESKLYMITAAETWLLRAEAALAYDGDAESANTLYQKGIETSMRQWEVSEENIVAFLASPTATLNGTNDEEQIGNQMWLALIPNFYEAWTYIRRSGYPVIPVREGPDLNRGVTNGLMPSRFKYSIFELASNNTNVQNAISKQGPNLIDTPVWWDKN